MVQMNYPTTKDGWASGFTDLSNDNASTRFGFTSELVPNPDLMLRPWNKMFLAAF